MSYLYIMEACGKYHGLDEEMVLKLYGNVDSKLNDGNKMPVYENLTNYDKKENKEVSRAKDQIQYYKAKVGRQKEKIRNLKREIKDLKNKSIIEKIFS